jgi:hypothetical protein
MGAAAACLVLSLPPRVMARRNVETDIDRLSMRKLSRMIDKSEQWFGIR